MKEAKKLIIVYNFENFKKNQKTIEETNKKYKSIVDYNYHLKFTSLPQEAEAMKTDISLKEKRERWHESLSKDIYVEEALNVLDDLQSKPVVKKSVPLAIKKQKVVKS